MSLGYDGTSFRPSAALLTCVYGDQTIGTSESHYSRFTGSTLTPVVVYVDSTISKAKLTIVSI